MKFLYVTEIVEFLGGRIVNMVRKGENSSHVYINKMDILNPLLHRYSF